MFQDIFDLARIEKSKDRGSERTQRETEEVKAFMKFKKDQNPSNTYDKGNKKSSN